MKKTLIGLAIAGGAALVALYVKKKYEKKYAEVQTPEEENGEESESVLEKIDKAAKKMAEWVLERENIMKALDLILPVIFSSALFLVELFFKVRFGRKAVDKTPTRNELKGTKNDLGNMTADQALEHVKKTKRNLLIVDSDNFGYVISPEVAA